jgi:hypothetical protein
MTSLTVDSLNPNTAYESRIWSVCSNGQDGTNPNFALSRTIIIDVVTAGYPAPPDCMEEDCELVDIGSGCNFLWTASAQTYFKIRKEGGGPERYFMITTEGDAVKFYPDNDNNNAITFLGVDGSFVRMFCTGYLDPVARVTAVRHSLIGAGELFRHTAAENHQDFKIFRLRPCSSQGRSENPPSWDANQSPIAPTAFVIAAPNPFTDQLEVQVNFPRKTEGVTLRMYDTQGREVSFLQAPAGLPKYSFPTAELPSGVYFLRAESAGQTQTIKVVKTL